MLLYMQSMNEWKNEMDVNEGNESFGVYDWCDFLGRKEIFYFFFLSLSLPFYLFFHLRKKGWQEGRDWEGAEKMRKFRSHDEEWMGIETERKKVCINFLFLLRDNKREREREKIVTEIFLSLSFRSMSCCSQWLHTHSFMIWWWWLFETEWKQNGFVSKGKWLSLSLFQENFPQEKRNWEKEISFSWLKNLEEKRVGSNCWDCLNSETWKWQWWWYEIEQHDQSSSTCS